MVSQAVALLVAQFSRAEDELLSEFSKQRDDPVALKGALDKAIRAGLTSDMSGVVRKVEAHLRFFTRQVFQVTLHSDTRCVHTNGITYPLGY